MHIFDLLFSKFPIKISPNILILNQINKIFFSYVKTSEKKAFDIILK
jgi:hypothetical protein